MSALIKLTPTQPPFERAKALHAEGRLAEAEQIYSAVLTRDAQHFDALHLLGLLRHQQGREVEALRLIGEALKVNPKSPDALSNLGLVFDTLKRHQDALEIFDGALALMSNHANALSNRALTLVALGRTDEALASWERALAADPRHVQALQGRGNALSKLKRYEEALADYERYLAIAPGVPDVFNNRGNAQSELGQLEESLVSYDRALALDPSLPEVLINKAHVLADLHRFDAALATYAAAAALGGKRAEALFSASLVRLRLGQFAVGWREYESRWKQASWGERARDFSAPLWLGGEPLAGKTVLLHGEQGFGDTLQFARYVPMVARLGATVILEVQPPLKALCSTVSGASQVLGRGETLPAFDLHCPLMSLPLAFNTDLASIPADIPYLDVPPDRRAKWRARLGEGRFPRIGFAWTGSPVHEKNRARSLSLARFAPLLSVEGLAFVSLQKDMDGTDADMLRRLTVVKVLGHELNDFADTAAVIAELDLVVAVDTSVVHLAGALGKPVWVLAPFSPDFRWLLDREDSPWYPTARLFRQPRYGDWDSVLARVRGELETFAASEEVPAIRKTLTMRAQ
jgi:tetratricopeptide (TPR) repeat protein